MVLGAEICLVLRLTCSGERIPFSLKVYLYCFGADGADLATWLETAWTREEAIFFFSSGWWMMIRQTRAGVLLCFLYL